MKKIIYLMIMLMVSFGFYGVVDATEEVTDISDGATNTTTTTTTDVTETDTDTDTDDTSDVEEVEDDTVVTGKEANPDTGLNDYAMYLVPVLVIGGSVLLFRRNSYN